MKEKSITWRSFWNGELGTRGPISKAWKVTGWPTTYLIDKDGVIRYKGLRGNALDQAIEELMAEMGEEVELVGVDHEAEDAEALKQAKEKAEAAKKAAAKKKAEVAEKKAAEEEAAKKKMDAEEENNSDDKDEDEDDEEEDDGEQ